MRPKWHRNFPALLPVGSNFSRVKPRVASTQKAHRYTRVTVERPLRLRYQMTLEDKARFLDACPHLLDDVQAIDKDLGREPQTDWNSLWESIRALLRKRESKWKATEQKLFRDVFAVKDQQAERVIAAQENIYGETGKGPRPGQTVVGVVAPDPLYRNRGLFPDPTGRTKKVFRYEPDADLRDFENIPLKEDVDAYFICEVLPHVTDAWMDRTKDKVGYEINFNRHFYKFTPPRELAEIDAEIEQAEKEFLRLFKEVTKE